MRSGRTSCAALADDTAAMEPLLFLTHRLPFPPNKGDKVRSFHLLHFLASRLPGVPRHLRRRRLGPGPRREARGALCVVEGHRLEALRRAVARRGRAAYGRGVYAAVLPRCGACRMDRKRGARARHRQSARFLVGDGPVRHAPARPACRGRLRRRRFGQVGSVRPVGIVAAQLAVRAGRAPTARLRALRGRAVHASVFVTPAEADLFRRLAPECAARVHCVRNGVDTEYFAPDASRPSPFEPAEEAIVFTGAMDYWPNVGRRDVVRRQRAARRRGGSPEGALSHRGHAADVGCSRTCPRSASGVTGLVPDVRPYLQHARVVVAPLRVARGIQNKVLEAYGDGASGGGGGHGRNGASRPKR